MRVGRRVRRIGAPWCVLWVLAPGVVAAHPGYDARLEAATAEVRAHPQDRARRLTRVELLRRAGHLKEALSDLAILARDDPDDPAMRIERALVRIAQGRTRAAERDLDAAIDSGSRSITALWERAKLREADGRLEAARADLEAAVELGGSPDLHLHLARVATAAGDLEAAAEGLARSCATLSGPVVLRLELVQAERRRSRFDDALAIVDTLLASAPRHADWLLLRAEILAELGRDDEALADRLRALAFANAAVSRRGTALHALARARVYLALELPEAALDDLERATASAPELSEAHALLRRVKESLG